jgi:LysR family cys regulon transcriptional activator
MNFQQLRIIHEAVSRDYNLTEVASALFTSQPGVSKQIRDIEDELGVEVFIRHGKRVLGLTEPGKEMISVVERMLIDAQNLQRIAQQFSNTQTGRLVIATTQTQSRYVLPPIIQRFRAAYPRVELVLHQGTTQEIARLLLQDQADIGIATEGLSGYQQFALFDCYQWRYALVVPVGHPLNNEPELSLQAIANYPLITYPPGYSGREHIDQAFSRQSLHPDIVLSAIDSDVIKTYVNAGLGIGIVTERAFDHSKDSSLRCLSTGELFPVATTRLAIRRGRYMRSYVYQFIGQVIPGLTEEEINHSLEVNANTLG